MKIGKLLLFCLFITNTLSSQDRATGLDFNQNKYRSIPLTAPILTRNYSSIPNSYSLKPYCPTPGNQGNQPSCVGWASGYGARTIAFAVKNNWKNNTAKINQNAFSPSFIYNQIKSSDDYNCNRGSYIADAMKLMNNIGILKKNDFEYNPSNCSTKPNKNGLSKAKGNSILTFERLVRWDTPYNLVSKVKKAISNKNPVVVGMFNYGKLGGLGNLWTPPAEKSKGGHAMVVIGYDNNKYGGAFEIMNSWGTKFRNKGFFWVRYADFKRYIKTAYVLIDKDQFKPNIIKNKKNTNKDYLIEGEITLKLSNGSKMKPVLENQAKRNFNIVNAVKATYSIDKAYTSGTQFRIYLQSQQKGYVYLIGYGSSDKSLNKLYPFDNFSPYFNYTNSEIAIPNEEYFIEFDNKPGQDILCVLYSKERLDINSIISKASNGTGDFIANIKKTIQYKMFKGSEISFQNDKIAFKAASNSSNSKIVPIFISVNHQ